MHSLHGKSVEYAIVICGYVVCVLDLGNGYYGFEARKDGASDVFLAGTGYSSAYDAEIGAARELRKYPLNYGSSE